jgi:outer membrane lipoprotein-sorting protein
MKPNRARLTITDGPPKGRMQMLLTGKDAFLVVPAEKQYHQIEGITEPAKSPLFNIGSPLVGAFFDFGTLKRLTTGATVRYTGTKTVGKTAYQTVTVVRTLPTTETLTAYFGPSGLWEGAEVVSQPPITATGGSEAPLKLPPPQTVSWWLRNVKVNPSLSAEQFAYKPPTGYTRVRAQTASGGRSNGKK